MRVDKYSNNVFCVVGGHSSLSRAEVDKVRAEVDKEFGTETIVLKKKKKEKARNSSQSNEDELGSLFGDSHGGKLPRFANKITFKNVTPGMKLWGVISEVNEKDLEVSLPGGLRGLVRASEAIDPQLHDEMEVVLILCFQNHFIIFLISH